MSKPREGARSSVGGHPIRWRDGKWVYEDGVPLPGFGGPPLRPCGRCGEAMPSEEVADSADACLGLLPGVDNACCGHGTRSESYIQFANGVIVRWFVVDSPADPAGPAAGRDEALTRHRRLCTVYVIG